MVLLLVVVLLLVMMIILLIWLDILLGLKICCVTIGERSIGIRMFLTVMMVSLLIFDGFSFVNLIS